MAKITKTFVDRVAPPAEGYAVHWDDSVKGYGLRVSKEGKRVFIVMGRVLGKSIQFTLGPYGTLTEDAARKRAQKVLQDMREGIDPRAVVKADAAMKVSRQDVLEAYVGRPGKMKDSTAREYRRHVEKTFAKWAPLPIASITRDMVKERHAALVKGGLEGKKAAPASANAAFVTLRILIRFATDEYRQADGTPLIRDNPVDALKHHWATAGHAHRTLYRQAQDWRGVEQAARNARRGAGVRGASVSGPGHLRTADWRSARRDGDVDMGSREL